MSLPRGKVAFQVIDDYNISELNDFLVLSIACTTIIVQGLNIKKAFNLFKGDLYTTVEFLVEISFSKGNHFFSCPILSIE